MNKKTTDNLETARHSCAHIVASAVAELYPGAKFGVGPVVENGFYYDISFPKPISDEALAEIEKKAKHLIRQNLNFTRSEMSIVKAINFFQKKKEKFKVELLKDLQKKGTTKISAEEKEALGGSVKNVSLYTTGDFVDLCRGPHVKNTKELNPDGLKLTKLAGAYWRGSEKNPMLTRIYGLYFAKKEELDAHLKMLEEAAKRDHRKLGKDLKIFTFSDMVGQGLPLWLPNGTRIIDQLESLARDMEEKAGYVRVKTPHIAKEIMYKTSGHLPYYADSMFPPMVVDEDGRKETYYLKAMNCPHHHQIFATEKRSYRSLPLRLAEYGTCYRYEKSGELFGLMRVRSMQMNDAHIYCAEEQFAEEFMAVVKMYLEYFKIFGIKRYSMRLSTHSKEGLGKKYINNEKLWKKTEKMVRDAMTKAKISFVEVADEAAFYGPKIDVQVWSAIGREFTLATNQVDFAVPERFGLTYTDRDGKEKTPICIHRAPLSTHERMIGFLLEHYAGVFPVWLAPVQVKILPVGEKFVSYGKKVLEELKKSNLRVELDDGNESLGKKIRLAEMEKVPYMLIVGEKEKADGTVAVRERGKGDVGSLKVEKFKEKILAEIIARS